MEMKERKIEEIELNPSSGVLVLVLNLLGILLSIVGIVIAAWQLEQEVTPIFVGILILSIVYLVIVCPILFCGLKILHPNEALVLTLFGKYYGTIKKDGYFFVNPFVTGMNPTIDFLGIEEVKTGKNAGTQHNVRISGKKISLKAMTLNNEKQKVNDVLGNPIEIGVIVIWRTVNPVKAVFNVDNFIEFVSIQTDSAIRNVARLYPYDVGEDGEEMTLRGSSQEVAEKLKCELQGRVEIAGIEIIEARITHLAYAPEIAAAMLQRQQASAIIDARKMIVDGAVGMVEMALTKLNDNDIVNLDEERKAAMVSNLLVVLCGNKDAQPIVNSGTIY